MNSYKKYFLLLAIGSSVFFSFWGCKPEKLPEPIEDDPDFYLEGIINNHWLDLVGGIDGYYMYTSYQQDKNRVYDFTGNLSKVNCQDCSGSIQVEIRDHEQKNDGISVDPSQSLKSGSYQYRYLKEEKKVFRVAFKTEEVAGGGNSFTWDFGDGNASNEMNPVHEFIGDEDAYEVCLQVITANNESTSICNNVRLSQEDCIADFTHELKSEYGNYVIFRSESRGVEPIRYLWDFGDGTQATLNNPGYYYPDDRLYTACLTIVDAQGCVSTICKNIATEPDVLEGNFSYDIQSATIPIDTLALSKVSVKWLDEDGTLFESSKDIQPGFSQFEILSSENYELNEKGQKTQRLKVRFSCRVFADGKFIDLKDIQGYIGVAYP